jgi:hypothetical protein
LMTEDIEGCLSVVLEALRKCDLPAAEVIAWCTAMLDKRLERNKCYDLAIRYVALGLIV